MTFVFVQFILSSEEYHLVIGRRVKVLIKFSLVCSNTVCDETHRVTSILVMYAFFYLAFLTKGMNTEKVIERITVLKSPIVDTAQSQLTVC